jgi:hypothetical protein
MEDPARNEKDFVGRCSSLFTAAGGVVSDGGTPGSSMRLPWLDRRQLDAPAFEVHRCGRAVRDAAARGMLDDSLLDARTGGLTGSRSAVD